MNPSFADLGVPAAIVANLDRRGITAPFPIQAATLPDILDGRDVCGRAPTGSGKTIAFGIPLVADITNAAPRHPRRLVLVPTRELASQVCDELRQLVGRGPDAATIEAIFGGVSLPKQSKALGRGVDIVVACPGRLADLINQKLIHLDAIDMVVLDEADRMADMGFIHEVKRLLDRCPSDRQTVLFSATLDGEVDELIKRYQTDPARHEIADAVDDQAGEATHHFWQVDRTDRMSTAAQVVTHVGSTIVFCRTKRGADRLARQLSNAGVPSAAIHGDRSQSQRERALSDFRNGRVRALVATDVAARGIHVDNVAGVVHFDPPADHKDYVHRSGRTARAGSDGVVISLVIPELRRDVGQLQRKLGLSAGIDRVDIDSLGDAAPMVITPEPSPTATARPASTRSGAPRSRSGNRSNGNGNGNRNANSGSSNGNRNANGGTRNSNGASRKANGAGNGNGGGNGRSRRPNRRAATSGARSAG